MTDDFVAWLRQQIDEDERLARATVPGPWYVDCNFAVQAEDLIVMENFDEPGPWHRALPEHIARWDSARVLREVEAKRRIMDLLTVAMSHSPWDEHGRDNLEVGLAENVLLALALPYADRPGYREEWLP